MRRICHVQGTGELFTGLWWGKLDGQRPLGSPKIRLEDNIKMELEEK